MLPRVQRLPKESFPLVMKHGHNWSAPYFSLKILLKPDKKTLTRLAIVVSAKVATRAVIRNRLKRQIRATLIKMRPRIKDNYDCLLFLKTPIKNLSFSQIEQSVEDKFKEAGLLRSPLTRP